MSCEKHEGSPFVKVCFSCNDQLVCSECTNIDHIGHIYREIEEAGRERQATLLQNLKETEAIVLAIQHDLHRLKALGDGNGTNAKNMVNQIQDRSSDLQHAVEQYKNQLVSVCERHQKDFEWEAAETKVGLESEWRQASAVRGVLHAALTSESFPEIIETETHHRNNPYKRQQIPIDSPVPIVFVNGTGTFDNLRHIFGDIEIQQDISFSSREKDFQQETETVKKRKQNDYVICDTNTTSTFKQTTSSFGVCFLCPSATSADDCWVRMEKMKEIRLVSRTGVHKQTVSFDTTVTCVANTLAGQLIVSCPNKHTIQEILPDGSTKLLFHVDRLAPRAVCLTTEGNILIGLADRWNYAVTVYSTRKVAKYTVRGYKMAEAEYDNFRKRLFVKPSRIAASLSSGDVAVINKTEYETSHLVILDKHLRLKCRYFGDGKIVSGNKSYRGKDFVRFCPQDVAYDSGNNILIAELYSCSIQLIDIDGHLLKILNTDEDIPWSLTLQNDRQLWVGYNSGKVKVLSYLQ